MNMEKIKVDVAIIGAGTAGMAAYRGATEHTNSVVLIESGPYGTTCAREGCMPSKLLIAAAEVSHQIDSASQFGIDVSDKRIQGQRVMERVKSERDRFVGFVEEAVENWPAQHKLLGTAVFIGPNELQVDEHTQIDAKRIVIAAGSRPAVPPPWLELGDRLLTNDDVFEWESLPESVAVVGTGVIGMELGQALSRLGVQTHLLGMGDQFGPISDPVINDEAHNFLEKEVSLHSDAAVEEVERTEQGVSVVFNEDGKSHSIEVDYLIAATGRRPNLDKLNLEAAGIRLTDQGIPAFDEFTGQIEDKPIFIAGDVSNAHPLLHEAADDGRIAGDNAGRYPDIRARPRRCPLSVIFTDPQIMLVGKSLATLEIEGTDFAVGEVNFGDQGRSRVIAKNTGRLRVYGEHHTGLFLGAEMVGPAAEHIGHLLSWAAQHRLTVQQMLDSPFYHPVIEEGVRTALRELNRNLLMGPVPIENCLDCGPGA
jgi:dihydrolipoamide dehydrogenase